jgi:hypothetical protein
MFIFDHQRNTIYNTSMFKFSLLRGMINSEQHMTIKNIYTHEKITSPEHCTVFIRM